MSIFENEIITPLRFIARVAGGAKKLQHSPGAEHELSANLDDLRSSTEYLCANAVALHDWIKYTWYYDLETEPIALRSEVAMALVPWNDMAVRTGVTLQNHVSEEVVVVTDQNLLHAILCNIIGAAVIHAGQGSTVRIEFLSIGHEGHLLIRDNGRGLNEHVLGWVQEVIRNGQLGVRPNFALGDGPGLAYVIVAALSALIGAKVQVESGDRGTSVTFAHLERV